MESPNYDMIIMCVIEGLYVFGFILIFCEVGNQLADEFDTINGAVYKLNWKTYPNEIQRLMVIVLQVTQQPVQLAAYGNYPCSRETFKKAISIDCFDS